MFTLSVFLCNCHGMLNAALYLSFYWFRAEVYVLILLMLLFQIWLKQTSILSSTWVGTKRDECYLFIPIFLAGMAWESIYILDQKVYRVHNGPNFILRHYFMKNIYKNIKMLLQWGQCIHIFLTMNLYILKQLTDQNW